MNGCGVRVAHGFYGASGMLRATGVRLRERIGNCGTPGGLRSRWRRRSLTDAACPLRVRALRFIYRNRSVGRDHWARRCRNYRLRTSLFVCTVCRCTERGRLRAPPVEGNRWAIQRSERPSERKHSGMNELCRPRRSERYAACADAGVAESRRLASVLRTR